MHSYAGNCKCLCLILMVSSMRHNHSEYYFCIYMVCNCELQKRYFSLCGLGKSSLDKMVVHAHLANETEFVLKYRVKMGVGKGMTTVARDSMSSCGCLRSKSTCVSFAWLWRNNLFRKRILMMKKIDYGDQKKRSLTRK